MWRRRSAANGPTWSDPRCAGRARRRSASHRVRSIGHGARGAGTECFERRHRRGHHHASTPPGAPFEGDLASVPCRGAFFLEPLVVFVDHDNSSEIRHRHPCGRAGADDRRTPSCSRPLVGGERHRDPGSAQRHGEMTGPSRVGREDQGIASATGSDATPSPSSSGATRTVARHGRTRCRRHREGRWEPDHEADVSPQPRPCAPARPTAGRPPGDRPNATPPTRPGRAAPATDPSAVSPARPTERRTRAPPRRR